MRARRPRPSEKTTSRVIPGFSPLGHPCRASPRGGAGSARPQRKASRQAQHCPPIWPRAEPQRTRRECNALPFARPYDAGAETAFLRENHLSRVLAGRRQAVGDDQMPGHVSRLACGRSPNDRDRSQTAMPSSSGFPLTGGPVPLLAELPSKCGQIKPQGLEPAYGC